MITLTQPDAILEPSVFAIIDAYFQNQTSQKELSDHLINSFINLPSLIDFISTELCQPLEIDYKTIQNAKLKELIFEIFDPINVDAEFNLLKDKPRKVLDLMQDSFWRQILLALLEKYPQCNFLLYTKQVEQGGEHLLELAQANDLVSFSSSLEKCLTFIFASADSINLQEKLGALVAYCCQSEEKYLFTTALLHSLEKSSPHGQSIRAVIDFFEEYLCNLYVAVDKLPTAISTFRLMMEGMESGPVLNAMTAIRNTGAATPGDILTIHRAYVTSPSPPVSLIRKKEFFDATLNELFGPSKVPPNYKDKYMWLLAFAACVPEKSKSSDPAILRLVNETKEALKTLEDILSTPNLATVPELIPFLDKILEVVIKPVGSMGFLKWLNYMFQSVDYEKNLPKERPYFEYVIMEQMAAYHPLQRDAICKVVMAQFQRAKKISVKQSCLELLVSLMLLGSVTPVLDTLLKYDKFEAEDIEYLLEQMSSQMESPFSDYLKKSVETLVDKTIHNKQIGNDLKQKFAVN